MPYLITTLTPTDVFGPLELGNRAKSRHAVVTLDEAEGYIFDSFGLRMRLPEGADWEGTIGPPTTPTTIEVEQVHRRELRAMTNRPHATGTDAEIVKAYNTAQGERV